MGALEVEGDFESWLERFKYQFLLLDKDDYSRAHVRAFWLAPRFVATDFGGSRQRDMGQVWTDTAKGSKLDFHDGKKEVLAVRGISK